MVKKFFVSLILLGCSPFSLLYSHDSYSEYWQQFFWKMWEKESFAIGTYVKIETGNHWKDVRSLQINEQLSWKVSENFSLELHYAYLHGRSVVPNSLWRWQHRLELEANYTFNFFCNCLIKTRNRLEIRRLEAEPKTAFRLRQRTMFVFPFEDKGLVKSFSVFNELFYNFLTNSFTENRVCPCRFTLELADKKEMDIFFLIQFFIHDDRWRKSFVFGTQFNF